MKKKIKVSTDQALKKWKPLEDMPSSSVITLRGHSHWVRTLIPLSDGTLLSGSYDKTIKHWSPESGKCLQTFKRHTASVDALADLGDGTFISGSQDNNIIRWDIRSGNFKQMFSGHANWISDLIALDGKIFLSSSWDNSIKLWDVQSGKCVNTYIGHTDRVFVLADLGDGSFVSGSYDNTIKRWDLKSGKCIRTYKGHAKAILGLALYDENSFVSASEDKSIKQWDIKSGKCLQTLNGHSYEIKALEVLPDRSIVSGSVNGVMKRWNIESGECLQTFEEHENAIWKLASLQDGSLISGSKDRTIKRWRFLEPPRIVQCDDIVKLDSRLLVDYIVDYKQSFRLMNNEWKLLLGLHANGIINDKIACYQMLVKTWDEYEWDNLNDANTALYKWLLDHYPTQAIIGLTLKAIDKPDYINLGLLGLLFNSVDNLLMLKFPYTLLCIAVRENLVDIEPAKKMLREALNYTANNFITNSRCVASYIFLIRSARSKKLISDFYYQQLKNIAQDAKTFSDPHFKQLEHDIEQLKEAVSINVENIKNLDERVSRNSRNIKKVAESLNEFKKAVEARNKRHFWLTIARSFLGLIPFGGFVGMGASCIEHVFDLSDVIEAGGAIKDVIEDICERSLDVIVEVGAEKIINPDKFEEIWAEAKTILEDEEKEQKLKGKLPKDNDEDQYKGDVSYKNTGGQRFYQCVKLRFSDGYQFKVEKMTDSVLCVTCTAVKQYKDVASTDEAMNLNGEHLCELFKAELLEKGFSDEEISLTLDGRTLRIEGDEKVINTSLSILESTAKDESGEFDPNGCVFA